MIERLEWLGLAATDPDILASFYADTLGLDPVDPSSTPIDPPPAHALRLGDGHLAIRSLQSIPSGGVHTHFAFTVSSTYYDELVDRLAITHDLTERSFGGNRSLYCIDPAGHCVEFGERSTLAERIGPIFEVVLEVRDLEAAEDRYTALGFDPVDRGRDRRRIRLRGPFDLELWEPHLGIADARGGCHVELGLLARDPRDVARHVTDTNGRMARPAGRLVVTDLDGHRLSLAPVED